MWRVEWAGNYSEVSRCFDDEGKARKFYADLIGRNKKIYKA